MDGFGTYQHDSTEKPQQMLLMWRIYDKAHMVTAWLSDLREDADLALRPFGEENKLLDEIIQQYIHFAPTQPARENDTGKVNGVLFPVSSEDPGSRDAGSFKRSRFRVRQR